MDKRNFNSESFEAYSGFYESREAADPNSEFEACDEFSFPVVEFEWEDESRHASPSGRGSRAASGRPGRFAAGQPGPPRTPVAPAPWPGRPRLRGIVRARPRILSVDEPLSGPGHDMEFIPWIQTTLNQLLGLRLRVDGVMDAPTRSALRRFQEHQGLPVDGLPGPNTRKALIEARRRQRQTAELGELAAGKEEWEAEVNRSSRDYAIWVQSSLNRIMGLRLVEDGIIGPATRSAIRSFQQKNRLAPDGIIEPETEAALIAAGASNPPQPSPTSYAPGTVAQPVSGRAAISSGYITIRSGVNLTPQIENVVRELDSYFRNANLKVSLTSAYRSPEEQLQIIRKQAIKRGIHRKYPSITTATVDDTESWLGAWDELLQRKKFIVNPPKPACSRIHPKKKCYRPSPHSTGLAFDLSGADLGQISGVVRKYCEEHRSLRQILVERTNNAVHVGIGTGGACRIDSR